MSSSSAAYSMASFGAGVYALVFLTLLVVSVGDTGGTYHLQAWFSWHTVYILLLVAESGGVAARQTQRLRRWHQHVRQVLSLLAAAQALGFAVWLSVEWANDSARNVLAGFYGIATVVLWVQMVVALVILYMSLVVSSFD